MSRHTAKFTSDPVVGQIVYGTSEGDHGDGASYSTNWYGTYQGVRESEWDKGVQVHVFTDGILGSVPQSMFAIPVDQFPHGEQPIAGYFSGEWEWVDVLECYENVYAAVRFTPPWSGGVCPIVTRTVLAALVARQQFLIACGETLDRWEWDGNGVRVDPSDQPIGDETESTWLLPDADGNYALPGYTYESVDLAEVNHIRKVG
jgi:hypothetical protein